MTDFFKDECIRRIETMQYIRKMTTSKTVLKNQSVFFYNEEFENKILEYLND